MLRFVILALMFAVQAVGQPDTIKVAINIDKTANLEQRVSSLINREIRGLRDVEIVDEPSTADYIVDILVIDERTESGRALGYVMSILVTSPAIPYNAFENEGIESARVT